MKRHSGRALAAAAALLLRLPSASGFAFAPPPHNSLLSHSHPVSTRRSRATTTTTRSTAVDDDVPSDVETPSAPAVVASTDDGVVGLRDELLSLARDLASASPTGRFITRPSDGASFRRAVNNLEAAAALRLDDAGGGDAGGGEREGLMLGDWTLIATANLPSVSGMRRRRRRDGGGGEKKGGWFDGGRKNGNAWTDRIRRSVQRTVTVVQRIRDDGDDSSSSSSSGSGRINRVDNVIEYAPPDTLGEVIPEESPLHDLLGSVNVNPLGVKRGKVVLIHRAEVESVEPVLRTKIAWLSSVLNVAGASRYLEPEGEDVFGLNNVLGEFVNVGAFDTPYVDDDVRVSRSSGPAFETLRLFVRSGSSLLLDEEGGSATTTDDDGVGPVREGGGTSARDVGSRVRKVADAAASLAENARDTIAKDMDPVAEALGRSMDGVAARVQDAVEEDMEQIGEAVGGVRSAIRGGGDAGSIGEAIANVTKAVGKVPRDVREIVEEDAMELGDKVEKALDNMVADVQDVVESDLKAVGDAVEEVRGAAAGGTAADEDDADDEEESDSSEEANQK